MYLCHMILKRHIWYSYFWIVCCMTPTTAMAQITWGAQIGTNFGSVVGPIEEGGKGRLKFYPNAALLVRVPLSDHWTLQPQISHSYKGADYSLPSREDSMWVKLPIWTNPIRAPYKSYGLNGYMKIHYLEMPLQFCYRWHTQGKSELTFGPQIGYLLRGESQLTQDSIVVGNNFLVFRDSTSDISSEYRRMDYGFLLGSNIWFNQHFFLNTRATCSLRSIYRKEEETLQDNFLNFFLFLGIGIVFP